MPICSLERERSLENPEGEYGCAFVLEDPPPRSTASRFCDAPRRPGSPYCPAHHARCYIRADSAAEERKLRQIEALADAVGGKRGRDARQPPPGVLRRFERMARVFSSANRSRFVSEKEDDAARS